MVGEANRCQNVRGLGGGGGEKKRDREGGGVCVGVSSLSASSGCTKAAS